MRYTTLFPQFVGLPIEHLEVTPDAMTMTATTTRRRAACPLCHRSSRRIHSRYRRRVTDLPCSGRPVILLVQARRFFCTTPGCPRRIFAERLPALVAPGARRSHGVQAALTRIGFAVGGEAGARLAQPLGYPVMPATLLRLVRAAPLPAVGQPRAVGIDDYAVRKGQIYGTLLCDLEQGRTLDLLPDRDADAVAAWFAARPSVTIMSRDRGQVYREGVTRGAPRATQVADRWHLAHNLSEALERVF